jgi:antitoxin (DNA-binding transcriptional repressor) of toxin-antitoxin stability system
MDASIVDLRYRMKDVLRAIERGEAVTVLYRGKAKATLMPLAQAPDKSHKAASKTADQPLFGLWKDRAELTNPVAWVRTLRQPRAIPATAGDMKHRTSRKPK